MADIEYEYFGKDVDLEACDAIMFNRWSPADRKKEVGLMSSKWFDVRTLHPVHATYLFAHIFTEETRKLIRAHIDPTPPKVNGTRVIDWEPIKAGDVFEPPTSRTGEIPRFWKTKITGLIRARQIADQYGIPYSFYIRAGLKAIYFGRFNILNSVAIPNPVMLTRKDIVDAILIAWVDDLSSRIYCAEHPRYIVANGDTHSDIEAHQKWLCDQIARKANPVFALRKYIKSGFLSPAYAAARFGEARVASIIL